MLSRFVFRSRISRFLSYCVCTFDFKSWCSDSVEAANKTRIYSVIREDEIVTFVFLPHFVHLTVQFYENGNDRVYFMSRRQWGQWFYFFISFSWHSPCKSVEFFINLTNYGLIFWYYLLKTGELWTKDSGPGWHSPSKSVDFLTNYGLISWYLKTGELWTKDSGPGSPYRRPAYSPCWKYIQLFTT